MKIDDLRKFQGIIQERDTLMRFINSQFSARWIGIYIPSTYELEFGRSMESHNVHLEDKSTIDAIMTLALPAARKRVADIEIQLTSAGVEYER
jgi:hypothetical protein